MKYLLFVLLLVGCTTHTEFGSCIGLLDKQNPKVEYELSVWNGFVAILFSETVVVPIYTVAKDISCPYKEVK